MTIVTSPDPIIIALMGKQNIDNKTYRLSRYVLIADSDTDQLYYHTLTCELIAINKHELCQPITKNKLIESWFMVPNGFDEYSFVKRIRRMRQLVYRAEIHKNMVSSVKRYWILTTTYCNANCFYCHEKGIPKMAMTEETAADVVQYIEKNSPDKEILLNWYGGEPLFNKKVIDIITSKLLATGFSFKSSMISNGLLFDSDTIEKSYSCWNLKQVQITLDGLENTYNRVKNYSSILALNPFRTVINGIEQLLQRGLTVQIRLNIDYYNRTELFELSDYLIDRFKRYKGFSIYSAPLFEECLGTTHHRSDYERQSVYEAHFLLTNKLNQNGVLLKTTLPKSIRSEARCIAVSKARVIFPDGQLAFCHDYMDGVLSGNIYGLEPTIDEKMSYTNCMSEKQDCSFCVRYPQCVRLVKCFNNKCNSFELKDWEYTTKREMLWAYQNSQSV